MALITKYDDFMAGKGGSKTAKPEVDEKPHQKSDEEKKPVRKSDNTPPQKSAVATIPDWKTY